MPLATEGVSWRASPGAALTTPRILDLRVARGAIEEVHAVGNAEVVAVIQTLIQQVDHRADGANPATTDNRAPMERPRGPAPIGIKLGVLCFHPRYNGSNQETLILANHRCLPRLASISVS
jgi:hypothetical protein